MSRAASIFKTAGRAFVADRALRSAAALSYYTIFSVVPLLFLVAAAAGFVFDDPAAVRTAVSEVTRVAGAEVGDALESLLGTIRAQRAGALSIGLVLAAFSASGMLQQAQAVLAEIFHVPPARRRVGLKGWLVRRGIAVGSSLGIALLALTPIAAAAAVDGLVRLLPDALAWLRPALRLGVPLLSALALMAVVGLTFQVLTAVKVPWKAAVRGGAATAVLASASAFLAGAYLSRVGASGALGAFSGAAILLLFFFIIWAVYLLGAEVTKAYGDYLKHGDVGASSHRVAAGLRHAADAPAARPVRPGPQGAAFVAGLVVGWLARSPSRRQPRPPA